MPSFSAELHGVAMAANPRLTNTAFALFAGLLAPVLLRGCAAVVLAGVATGAAAAHDRRFTATVLADDTSEI